MEVLLPHAERVAALLIARKETIAVAESSSGGLIAAALLAVPGASAYFAGGAVLYTRNALLRLTQVDEATVRAQKPTTEGAALLRAQLIRERLSATWGLSEAGVAGPTANRYGYQPGHTCLAVSGPVECTKTIDTGSDDRLANMYAFAKAALELLEERLNKM